MEWWKEFKSNGINNLKFVTFFHSLLHVEDATFKCEMCKPKNEMYLQLMQNLAIYGVHE